MHIGMPVVFCERERSGIIKRSALISELDKDGLVHLTVFNRPVADTIMKHREVFTTVTSVPFVASPTVTNPSEGEPIVRWCQPVASKPATAAPAPAVEAPKPAAPATKPGKR